MKSVIKNSKEIMDYYDECAAAISALHHAIEAEIDATEEYEEAKRRTALAILEGGPIPKDVREARVMEHVMPEYNAMLEASRDRREAACRKEIAKLKVQMIRDINDWESGISPKQRSTGLVVDV